MLTPTFCLSRALRLQANYRFKHALIQDAAYDSLLKSRRQALHRRAAELLRDDPERAAAEPEIIAHHFTEAGLDDLGIEWWGKAGDQALRRSAFQEAIAHLGKAIEMADKAAARGGQAARRSSGCRNCTPPTATRSSRREAMGRRKQREAFAERARSPHPATRTRRNGWRQTTVYGSAAIVRGELGVDARAHAAAFLRDVEARPNSPEAGVAHRVLGTTHWFAGEYREAREHLERALALFQPGRDDDLAFRFGQDAGVAAMVYLAIASWPLGDVERAVSLVRRAEERIASVAHIGTHRVCEMDTRRCSN